MPPTISKVRSYTEGFMLPAANNLTIVDSGGNTLNIIPESNALINCVSF